MNEQTNATEFTDQTEQLGQEDDKEEDKTNKRHYTRREQMLKGNQAILDVLPTTLQNGLNKAQIFAKLSQEDREMVEHNWSLRIQFLEETEQVISKGAKIAKIYARNPNQTQE